MHNFYWVSLFLLPLPALSQTKPENDFYAGLEVGYNAYLSGFGWAGQGFAPTLTIGTHLKPGLTLQLGLGTSQIRYEHREQRIDRKSYPRPFLVNAHYQTRERTLLLPALLRFDLGRRAQRPLQVQAIAGVTVMAIIHYDKATLSDSTYAVYSSKTNQSTSFGLGLTGGGGLLYTVGPRLDLTGSALLNFSLTGGAGITSTVAIGARYYLKARLGSSKQ